MLLADRDIFPLCMLENMLYLE